MQISFVSNLTARRIQYPPMISPASKTGRHNGEPQCDVQFGGNLKFTVGVSFGSGGQCAWLYLWGSLLPGPGQCRGYESRDAEAGSHRLSTVQVWRRHRYRPFVTAWSVTIYTKNIATGAYGKLSADSTLPEPGRIPRLRWRRWQVMTLAWEVPGNSGYRPLKRWLNAHGRAACKWSCCRWINGNSHFPSG